MDSPQQRILYVNDNADDCELATVILETAGFPTICTDKMTEGLQLAQTEPFALYILDMRFPDGWGTELARQLKELTPQTPLMFYTASAFAEEIASGMNAGALAYLTKPCDPKQLIQTAQNLIRAAKIGSENSYR